MFGGVGSPDSTGSLDALEVWLKAEKVAESLALLVVLGSPDSAGRPGALVVLPKA